MNRTTLLSLLLVASGPLAVAQSTEWEGLYQITSGTYVECCGIAGGFQFSLPNATQRFVRLTSDPQSGLAIMAFLGSDMVTVFSTLPCPVNSPIQFNFDGGSVFPSLITFNLYPSPPSYALSWNYSVSISPGNLLINGTLGMVSGNCSDVPTTFTHTNIVASLVAPPTIRVTEFSDKGASLFIQGNAFWTDVVEASADLVSWTPIWTNVMPATVCPLCPFLTFQDSASTNLVGRFYRCYEIP